MKTKNKILNRFTEMKVAALAALAVAALASTPALAETDSFTFNMVRNSGGALQNALPHAHGSVTITAAGAIEVMEVVVTGLLPNTDYDFFVIQVPHPPFGLSWYQGDIEANSQGVGHEFFIGRFSIETFIVAPGVAPAPVVFNGPFPDASANPATNPVQLYHLGLWFNNPSDAVRAGALGTVTPFNGEHNAGVQVLNTSNFPDNFGPLRAVNP
jgi:hypothetical protein